MLSFSNGLLRSRQVDLGSKDTAPMHILDDIRDSFEHYVFNVNPEDIKYLEEKVRTIRGLETFEFRLPKVLGKDRKPKVEESVNYRNNEKISLTATVEMNIALHGEEIIKNWEILRIPTLQDFNKFNFEGSLKAIPMQLESAYDVSYSAKNKRLTITMPKMKVNFDISDTKVCFHTPDKNFDVLPILIYMLHEAGDDTPITEYISNVDLLKALHYDPRSKVENIIAHVAETGVNFVNRLKSDYYKLGPCREPLNEALSLRRGLGQRLSRDLGPYREGTIIDEAFLDYCYDHHINTYHIINDVKLDGTYYYAGPVIVINEIPRGFQNCAKLRKVLPQYKHCPTIPVDINGLKIIYGSNAEINQEDFDFLRLYGYHNIPLHVKKTSQTSVVFCEEREITSNYIAPWHALTDKEVTGDRSATDMVYYYNNENLEERDLEHLTAHDLLAIVSLLGEIITTKKTTLLDIDIAFLKRVAMCDEMLSQTLRKAIDLYVHDNKSKILRATQNADCTNPFYGLSDLWRKMLLENTYIQNCDTTNVCDEVSQACRVNTPLHGAHEVDDAQRHLALPFYGRICNFETPAGAKIGLVNSRAVGSKLEDGLLKSPYRRVVRSGNGIRISDQIVYLSVREELGHRFGDILSLKKDANGDYINNKVLARVPNPDPTGDPFIFKNINAYELAGTESDGSDCGYVEAYPEQSLSPVACLMPFIGSNNPVRVSFGLAQLKQAINILDSEVPFVITPMYQDIFKFASNMFYHAPVSGVITKLTGLEMVIKSDEDDQLYTTDIQRIRSTETMAYLPEFHAKVGEHVKKGQLVVEMSKHPADFVVRAPRDGYITAATHNSITIESDMNFKEMRDDNTVVIPVKPVRVFNNNILFMNTHVSIGDYVHKGDILADTCTSREGYLTLSRNPLVMFMPYGYNYEDGVVASEKASIAYTSLLTTKIVHKEHTRNYSRVRLNSPYGFHYCDHGDVITSVEKYYDKDADLQKGDRNANVYASHKSHGIYYKRDTLETSTDKKTKKETSRTYALHMFSMNRLKGGDKMSGRHGNKGVTTRVIPDSEAPQLSNGLTAEIILGPCGVPSRMNLGQMLEIHSSLIMKVLGIRVESPSYNGLTLEEVDMLMKYTYRVANEVDPAPGAREATLARVIADFPLVPKELHEHVRQHLDEIFEWRGVFNDQGCASVYDPVTDSWIDNVVIGFPMFNKLMQEADEKMNARAGLFEESYAQVSYAPLHDGITSAKGQRMAEMEVIALASLGASNCIKEIINEKSDNPGARSNSALRQLGETDPNYFIPEEQCNSHAVEQLSYMLEVLGIKMEFDDDYMDTSPRISKRRKQLRPHKYLEVFTKRGKEGTAEEEEDDFE